MRRSPGDMLGCLKPEEVIWFQTGDPLDDGIERWRIVVGFNTNYAVSTLGRVMRITPGPGTRPGRLLRAAPDNYGYVMVQLSYGPRKRKKLRIHRLVAIVFLPHDDEDVWCDVHHINHNRKDNKACNLEWQNSAEHRLDAWNDYIKYGRAAGGLSYGRGLEE